MLMTQSGARRDPVAPLGERRFPSVAGAAGATGVAVLLMLLPGKAAAAAIGLGAMTSSAGLMAALAALVALQAALSEWSGGHLPLNRALLVLAAMAALVYWAQRRSLRTVGAAPPTPPARASTSWWSPTGDMAIELPAPFERSRLLAEARGHFMRLQDAWDGADVAALERLTTAAMLQDLRHQLSDRGPGPNRTDVVTLHAELIGFEELPTAYLASIEYSGLIREGDGQGPAPFRELWMLARPKAGETVWRLARQQALL